MHSLEVSRRWENLQHPYIVFHANKKNFAFMGIYLDRRRYQFVNPNTNEVFMIHSKVRILSVKYSPNFPMLKIVMSSLKLTPNSFFFQKIHLSRSIFSYLLVTIWITEFLLYNLDTNHSI